MPLSNSEKQSRYRDLHVTLPLDLFSCDDFVIAYLDRSLLLELQKPGRAFSPFRLILQEFFE